MISISQLSAARALLGWSQEKLAEHAQIPFVSLLDYEGGGRRMPAEASAQLKKVLEKAGIIFADDETGVSLMPAPETVPLEGLNASNDE